MGTTRRKPGAVVRRLRPAIPLGPARAGPSLRATGLLLIGIIGLGAALRIANLDRHFFWFDEGLLLNLEELGKTGPDYVLGVWRKTTYNPGWAALVWLVTQLGGTTLRVARIPSCAAGILAIGATFAAAWSLRLDRPAALAAALLMALCWPQVEYSQQVLPYAGIPLLTALVLLAVGMIGRTDPARSPRASLAWKGFLATVCTLQVANHNSFIMFLPLLAFCLLGVTGIRSVPGPSRPRWAGLSGVLDLASTLGCLAGVSAIALVFLWPKRGEGYRPYLNPYYLATFRDHRMGYGGFLDPLYARLVPHPSRLADPVYFGLSRAYDLLSYSVNLFSPIYVDPLWGVLAIVPVSLAVAGMVVAMRRTAAAPLRGLSLGLVLTLAGLLGLSTWRLYPFGGIRQILFLTPLVMILAAVGWRAAVRRWPRAGVLLTGLCLAGYAARVPGYYIETTTRCGARQMLQVIQASDIRTIATPDLGYDYFNLNYLVRKIPKAIVLDTRMPEFGVLVHRRKPFLFFSSMIAPPLECRGGRAEPKPEFRTIVPSWIDFHEYDAREWIAHGGGPFRGGQPNPGAFLYSFRARPGLAPIDPRPVVTAVTPADGARCPVSDLDQVEVDFSGPLDPRSLGPASLVLFAQPPDRLWTPPVPVVPAAMSLAPRRDRVVLQTRSPLPPNVYSLRVDPGIRDRAGRRLAAAVYSSFEVVADPLDPRLFVTAVEPSDGERCAVAPRPRIAIDFSGPLDPASLTPTSCQLLARPPAGVWNPAVPVVPAAVTLARMPGRVILEPKYPLTPNVYVVRVGPGIRDRAGRRLAAAVYSSFEVAADPLDPRLFVTAVKPSDGARSTVSQSARIEIDFSGPLDPASLTPTSCQLLAQPPDHAWKPQAPVPAAVSLAPTPGRVILTVRSPLAPNVYMVRVDQAVRDRAGRHLAAPVYSSFEVVADR